jgi:aspartate aminotransferase
MLNRFVQGANRQVLSQQRTAAFSNWSGLTSAPADPILGLNDAFKKETNAKKVLLGMGAYRDD